MNTITIPSKMNFEQSTQVFYHNERLAREMLKNVPLNAWVYFKDIPYSIRGDVINILDSGYSVEYKILFDETDTKFLITRGIPEQMSLNLKRYHKP